MDTIVASKGSGLTYVASSLEDIAATLESLASKEAGLACSAGTIREQRFHRGSQYAYNDAAAILRATTMRVSEEI